MRLSLLLISIIISSLTLPAQEKEILVFASGSEKQTDFSENTKEPEIKIFPVPVNENRFTITSDTPFIFVRMTNIIGQEVTRSKLTYPVKRKVIEFPGTEKGIYLVSITLEDNRKIVRKILVDTGR